MNRPFKGGEAGWIRTREILIEIRRSPSEPPVCRDGSLPAMDRMTQGDEFPTITCQSAWRFWCDSPVRGDPAESRLTCGLAFLTAHREWQPGPTGLLALNTGSHHSILVSTGSG